MASCGGGLASEGELVNVRDSVYRSIGYDTSDVDVPMFIDPIFNEDVVASCEESVSLIQNFRARDMERTDRFPGKSFEQRSAELAESLSNEPPQVRLFEKFERGTTEREVVWSDEELLISLTFSITRVNASIVHFRNCEDELLPLAGPPDGRWEEVQEFSAVG